MPRGDPNYRLKTDLRAICDRCGGSYVIDAKLGQYRAFAVVTRNVFGQSGKTYFLCPECMKEFNEWIGGKSNDVRNNTGIN